MSSAPQPDGTPRDDSKVASIAWAVAAIVVALVIAFIAWLAMGDRGGSAAPDATGSAPTQTETQPEGQTEGQNQPPQTEEATQPDATGPATGTGTGPDAAAPQTGEAVEQTPPPEVVEMMLGLQRRDAEDVMAVGEVDAPVVMIEYADYRCPYCAQFATQIRPELDALVDDGTLRVEFRDLVLFEETSELAAVAARAAAAQGHLKDYQHEVFSLSLDGHGEYDRQDLIDLAAEVGVPDLDAFEAALDDPSLLEQVRTDTAEARGIGVSSTPTFLINTQVVQGAYPATHFQAIIEAERAKVEDAQGR